MGLKTVLSSTGGQATYTKVLTTKFLSTARHCRLKESTSMENPERALVVGDVVRLRGDDPWGIVVEICHKWKHDGARVMWTGSGEIAWAPLHCLKLMYSSRGLSDV